MKLLIFLILTGCSSAPTHLCNDRGGVDKVVDDMLWCKDGYAFIF